MKIRTYALLATAVSAALVLAGCGQIGNMDGMDMGPGSDPMPSEVSTDFNAADEMFATMMIPHHEQAIEMAQTILDKPGIDERVTALAERIKAAQAPEIDTMTALLESWGLEPADSGMGGMEGMADSGGLMSAEDMAALESAEGPEAARLFLEQMIQHHQGAIAMAEQEVANGVNPDAVDLAQAIIDDQTAEIAEIEALLAQL